ncbi:ComEC/Rec2 family competence protein [Marinivivus vitaminiproducens]|uniref:ComEC/Rec2 family competence protein n=1 Tax=Marinivivus vitaminiproducens TaxID=3035935 RepID=UPI0027AA590A|nr:ComEC/Rec2 family competence protein [Geminicoccaceae bacterium SCSIO 64248]
MGAGIAAYFALRFEPSFALGLVLLVALLTGNLSWLARRWQGQRPLRTWAGLLLLAASLGFTTAQLHAWRVDAPSIGRRGVHTIEATVGLVEGRERGHRIQLDRPVIEGLGADRTPVRLRVTLRSGGVDVRSGDRIRLRAVLMPPSPPSHPGGFDFARRAYFERLGGVGFALGKPERLTAGERSGLADGINDLRRVIDERIRDRAPGDAGAVAAALIAGLRASISAQVWESMQATGLVHILSISGLHVSLVTATVFLLVRLGLTLCPPLALRIVPKKAAAAVAIAAAFGYMLLAGAPVPTQRSFLTCAVALLAVMLDRDPLSMRLLAAAAAVVMLADPESVLGPSFQMSFAAVIALIAAYEGTTWRPLAGHGRWAVPVRYAWDVALTTLIASLVTAPLAILHFQRLALFGIVANLIAVPLTAFWIMPAGLLVVLLMPFGLDGWAIDLMTAGIGLMLGSAAMIADWPAASALVPQPPGLAAIVAAAGGLWLALWRRRWRWFGLAGPALGLMLAMNPDLPDVLISQDGAVIGVRDAEGTLALSPWQRDAFTTDDWLAASGQAVSGTWPDEGTGADGGLACDPLGCILERDGRRIAFARRGEALSEDCRSADLVVSLVSYAGCPRGRAGIDRGDLWWSQGMALWVEAGGIRRLSVREARGERPWVR